MFLEQGAVERRKLSKTREVELPGRQGDEVTKHCRLAVVGDFRVSVTEPKRLAVFERWLSLWVALCMVAGVALGRCFPAVTDALRRLEFGEGSQINVPIAVLLWLMIYPMMLRIDLASVLGVRRRPQGVAVTLFVNWLVKPFSMAFLGWLFFQHLFHPWIGDPLADQYVAGVIILAAAPCTAGSRLRRPGPRRSDGSPA